MDLHAPGRSRLAWLDRFIAVWPVLGARGSQLATSPAGAT